MNQDDTIVCKETLRYFGTMLPSLSHEAKNVLAVINENAGLMDDYILMAQKGKSLNLERLGSLSAIIKKQVVRLNGLITDVRQAATSVDIDTQDICLVHHARQVSELLSKKAATRSVQIELSAGEEPILIHTRPVLLLHILWTCLDYAMRASREGSRIGLHLEKRTQSVAALITGIDIPEPMSISAVMPDEQRNAVLLALNAELKINETEKKLMLIIRIHHV